MKNVVQIRCKTHGLSDESLVLSHIPSGRRLGVFCARCFADFIQQNIGVAEAIEESGPPPLLGQSPMPGPLQWPQP